MQQREFSAGEAIKCVADGNPPPKITFTPPGDVETGHGWSALTVKDEWVGVEKKIT